MREIVLDTETTGTDPASGDRIVEIGMVELLDHIPTGESRQIYCNPQRPMPEGAFRVHGLSDQFLADKPLFAAVAEQVAAFLADARLVIHNAAFDIGFLNAEFARTGHPALAMTRVVDTLALARRRHPGAQNSLDALCARYGVDSSRRIRHGALLDAEILAEVYLELIGGRQTVLGLGRPGAMTVRVAAPSGPRAPRAYLPRLADAEREAHSAFIATLGPSALWREYLGEAPLRREA